MIYFFFFISNRLRWEKKSRNVSRWKVGFAPMTLRHLTKDCNWHALKKFLHARSSNFFFNLGAVVMLGQDIKDSGT